VCSSDLLADYWLLTGDEWAHENAELLGKRLAQAASQGEFGADAGRDAGAPRNGEGEAGWNLTGLLALYRATGARELLEAAQEQVEEVLEYQDPVRGCCSAPILERRIGDDPRAYEGGTVPGSGALMRGLVMYYEETGDPRVAWAIVRLCDWMDCEMSPAPGLFRYQQAPEQRGAGAPCPLVLDGTAFAYNFTGSEVYRRLALATYQAGMSALDLTNMRDLPHALALLATALPPVRMSVQLPPLAMAQAGRSAPLAVTIKRTTREPLAGRVRVLGPGDQEIAAAPFALPPAQTEATVGLALPATQQGPVTYRVALEVNGREVTSAQAAAYWLPALPRILLFAGDSNLTERALQATGLAHDRQPPSAYDQTDLRRYDVVIFGLDEDRSVLDRDPKKLLSFVEAGGVFLGMRYQGPDEQWLPSPASQGPAFEAGRLARPEAAVLHSLHELDLTALRDVHGGSMVRAFCALGPKWTPILAGDKPRAEGLAGSATPGSAGFQPASPGEHYGPIEMDHGWGRIVLCQLIPEYAWMSDAAGADCAGRWLFENLVVYAAKTAAANKQ
jgi:hypothetical protein